MLAEKIVEFKLTSFDIVGVVFSVICGLLLPKYGLEALKLQFIHDIEKERSRQNELYGIDNYKNSLIDWKLILIEEYGELVQAYNNNDINNAYVEAVQTSAVWVQIIEHYLEKMEEANAGNVRQSFVS